MLIQLFEYTWNYFEMNKEKVIQHFLGQLIFIHTLQSKIMNAFHIVAQNISKYVII